MPPKKGTRTRKFPTLSLEDAIVVPRTIEENAGGQSVNKIVLANLLGRSPSSSEFERLTRASRMFELTSGGPRSESFSLTELGIRLVGADEVAAIQARKEAVLSVSPFRVFLEAHNLKKIPADVALKDFLVRNAEIPTAQAAECSAFLLSSARFAGLITVAEKGGGEWVDLNGSAPPSSPTSDKQEEELPDESQASASSKPYVVNAESRSNADGELQRGASRLPKGGNKVFIAHGKNREPLNQLKKMLDQFKVPYAVAVDEPNAGRPISAKVAALMRDECSSGIFIFTSDERFLREDEEGNRAELWRPSENVVYQLGAASVLYDNRIVIFKEDGVKFPSDFSDLGYITFQSDQLVTRMGDLFGELVKLDILEVRAKQLPDT